MNSLLVLSNLEEDSLPSLQSAINIAKKMGLAVVAFHLHKMQDIDDVSSINPNFESRRVEYQTLLEEKLEKKLNRQISSLPNNGVNITTKIYFAEEIEAINQIIDKNNAIMLIIPSVDSEFDSFIGGNLSEKLVRLTSIPVLINRNKVIENIKSILFPFDFKQESFQALLSAEEIASAFAAKISPIHVTHINPPVNVTFDRLDLNEEETETKNLLFKKFDKLEASGLIDRINLVNSEHSAKETFLNHTKNNHADLIILGSQGKSAFERLYLGSFCEYLLEESSLPLLITKSF